ncbi:phospholipase [bacterium]|nr:phospholipase [bacterium]
MKIFIKALKFREILVFSCCIFLLWWSLVAIYQNYKPLPVGLNIASEVYPVPLDQIHWLFDLTYPGSNHEIVRQQAIFNEIFSLIDHAQNYILLDMFLFNAHKGKSQEEFVPLSHNLTQRLLQKKLKSPAIRIDLITDPINLMYGGAEALHLQVLRAAGVNVIITDLQKLRDSNFIYSSLWRIFLQWWGNSFRRGWLPHPFDQHGARTTLRSYLHLLNFKANHRKVCLVDAGGAWKAIVTSANPHDASAWHCNVGVLVSGEICRQIYAAEQAIAQMSGSQLQSLPETKRIVSKPEQKPMAQVQVLTEGAIKKSLLTLINQLDSGEKLFMAMFYLSERKVINALKRAAHRGADIKIILDANKHAFGYEKNGIPNRLVAHELHSQGQGNIQIRWYNSGPEQFHTKLVGIKKQDNQLTLLLGSANLTRRNISNYNLELNLAITAATNAAGMQPAQDYFRKLWNNQNNTAYTLALETYVDSHFGKRFIYYLQEITGLSSF